jgi:hypothetical protein
MEDTLVEGFKGHGSFRTLIGYALSSDLPVTYLQRFEQRFLIPLQLF